jgi:predicted PurR-regulated permease PerM
VQTPARNGLPNLFAVVLVTASLYVGREVLIPIALALLVSFCLAPLVFRIERIGLGRLPAAIAVVLFILFFLTGIGWLVARETAELATELPTYRANLRTKVHTLRGPLRKLSGAAESISDLEREMQVPDGQSAPPKVEVVEPPSVVGTVSGLLSSMLDYLAVAGIVAVLSLFMLLEREELRDRLIWLTGGRDLSVTTSAFEDAESRVARYLGSQSLIAAIHGTAVTAGLLWIGVPGAVVWGTLAALLRFLPYFGPWITASLPIVLSIAAFPDWQHTAMTASLFIVLEMINNNLLEPWLYGTSAGLSPFGVIFSAIFWTWLWGIPGLVLATPLTVCLVVAGRYVPWLEFVSVMLGDRPALAAETRFYQRLLALDLDEADEVLRGGANGATLETLTDSLILPALRRLATDQDRELITADRADEVRQRLDETLERLLASRQDEATVELAGMRALFAPALDACDAAAARWLSKLLAFRGASAELVSERALVSETVERIAAESPDLVCVSALTRASVPHARLLCARIVALDEPPTVAAGFWAAPEHELPRASTKESPCTWITRADQLTALANSLRARLPSERVAETSGAGGASFSWGMGGR